MCVAKFMADNDEKGSKVVRAILGVCAAYSQPADRARQQDATDGGGPRLARACSFCYPKREAVMNDAFQHFDPRAFRHIARFARRFGRWYFRYRLEGLENLPDGPCLVVGNHSGLGFAEEALMLGAWEERHGTDRRAWGLIHDFFFSAPFLGHYYRRIGAIPASRANAKAAFARGDVVLVFPGGDLDCCRPFYEPHRVHFGNRRGYIELALAEGVPVLPIATTGSHWTWTFLPGGATLARIPWVRRLFRSDRLPIPTALLGLLVAALVVALDGLSWWWMLPAAVLALIPTPITIRSRLGTAFDLAAATRDMPDDERVEFGHQLVHGRLESMVLDLAGRPRWDDRVAAPRLPHG